MHISGDSVDMLFIDQQARVTGLNECLPELFNGCAGLNCSYLGSWNHAIADFDGGKCKSIMEKLDFFIGSFFTLVTFIQVLHDQIVQVDFAEHHLPHLFGPRGFEDFSQKEI